MTGWVAGLDGCKGGWLALRKPPGSGAIEAEVVPDLGAFFAQGEIPHVVGVDIPIGLTEHGPRACDRLARKLLGAPRSSSVFPAPIRSAVQARSRLEAQEITRRVDGRGVGPYAWGLYKRIREVDAFLQANPAVIDTVYEIHPELAFMAMNGGAAIAPAKKTGEGRAIRLELLARSYGPDPFARVRSQFRRSQVLDDDILDALAVLWSAERIRSGRHAVVPDPPPRDSTGLRMGIWY